jgi:hypothetical protein
MRGRRSWRGTASCPECGSRTRPWRACVHPARRDRHPRLFGERAGGGEFQRLRHYPLLSFCDNTGGEPATVRLAVLRCVPCRPQPLTASAPAGASATGQARRGGPQVRPLGCRLSPPASTVTMRCLKPAPSMTRRWPRTGSACRPAIRCRNAGSPRCSDAHPAAGREPESPMHDRHRRS